MHPIRALAKTSLRSAFKGVLEGRNTDLDSFFREKVYDIEEEDMTNTGPESMSFPVPYGSGRVMYVVKSRSREGVYHEVVVDVHNMKCIECSCEAGSFGNRCWHMALVEQNLEVDVSRCLVLFRGKATRKEAIDLFTDHRKSSS